MSEEEILKAAEEYDRENMINRYTHEDSIYQQGKKNGFIDGIEYILDRLKNNG